jgi:hypothetical protein
VGRVPPSTAVRSGERANVPPHVGGGQQRGVDDDRVGGAGEQRVPVQRAQTQPVLADVLADGPEGVEPAGEVLPAELGGVGVHVDEVDGPPAGVPVEGAREAEVDHRVGAEAVEVFLRRPQVAVDGVDVQRRGGRGVRGEIEPRGGATDVIREGQPIEVRVELGIGGDVEVGSWRVVVLRAGDAGPDAHAGERGRGVGGQGGGAGAQRRGRRGCARQPAQARGGAGAHVADVGGAAGLARGAHTLQQTDEAGLTLVRASAQLAHVSVAFRGAAPERVATQAVCAVEVELAHRALFTATHGHADAAAVAHEARATLRGARAGVSEPAHRRHRAVVATTAHHHEGEDQPEPHSTHSRTIAPRAGGRWVHSP